MENMANTFNVNVPRMIRKLRNMGFFIQRVTGVGFIGNRYEWYVTLVSHRVILATHEIFLCSTKY